MRVGSTENLACPFFDTSSAISCMHMIGNPFSVGILASNIKLERLDVVTKCKREVHTCASRTGCMALKTERDCNPTPAASCNTPIMIFPSETCCISQNLGIWLILSSCNILKNNFQEE